MATPLSKGLVAACRDRRLFRFKLWDRQRQLLEAVEAGPRLHVWALGRRSGKSTMGALVALWDCLLRPELGSMVRPGETRYAVAVATNHQQARLIVAAARSIVERSRALAGLVEAATEDEIRFRLPDGSRTALRAFPCSSRGGRGWPISCLVLDEAAHHITETDGYQAGERVWRALAPSTAQFGDLARVIVCSTPFGQTGFFAELHGRALAGELEGAVAHHATTAEVNPTISARFLAAEEARDPDSYRGEYLAEFVGSGNAYLDFERIDPARVALAPREAASEWVAGLDPAFARDPFGVALVGRANASDGQLVVGPVRALRGDGDFGGVVDEVAELAKAYGARVVTDQFSSAAVVDRLRHHHRLAVEVHNMSAASKTAIFGELRARLYNGSLRLPDHPPLVAELQRLRTKFTAGSASVMNPRVGGSHGDMAQALALATYELRDERHQAPSMGPDLWNGADGIGLDRWKPRHCHELHPDREDHLATMRQLRQVCPGCAEEQRRREEARRNPPPPPPPERRGKFLIHRDGRRRR